VHAAAAALCRALPEALALAAALAHCGELLHDRVGPHRVRLSTHKTIMSGGRSIRCEKPKKQKGVTTAPERFLTLYTRKTSSTRPRLSACVDRKARSITYLRHAKGEQDRKFLALNTAYDHKGKLNMFGF
jgi:hypothetical protein